MKLYDVFINKNIIKNGHFILRSGKHSDIYIEKTMITLFPCLHREIIRKLSENISKIYRYNDYDIITGPAVAGISFAAPIAIELDKPFIFSEKINENNFKFRPEFEKFIKNKRILIIEDIITTGNSILKLSEIMYSLGGITKSVFCIMNRNSKLKEIKGYIYPYSYPIHSLITKDIVNWNENECPTCIKNMTNR